MTSSHEHSEARISVNGKITSPEDAVVSAEDRGLLLGDMIFEVLVAYGKTLINLDHHLARLRAGAERIGLELNSSDAELRFELEALLELTGFAKSYLRLTITRGQGMGVRPRAGATPTRIIHCYPAPAIPTRLKEQGLKLALRHQNYTRREAALKTANYLDSISQLAGLAPESYDDILWCNSEGELTEASSANIFLLGRMGDLVEIATPGGNSGLLEGITRQQMMSLLQDAKIPVTVRTIYHEEIPRFDEGFVCSSVRGLIPIAQIDGHKLHTTRQQSTFRHILRLYQSWLASILGHYVDISTGAPTPKP